MQTENIPGSPAWSFVISDTPADHGVFRRVKDPSAGPDDPVMIWRRYLPWVPQVNAVYVLSDNDGTTLDVQVKMTVRDQAEIVRLDDVRDGVCWTRFHHATGAASKSVKDVLSNICSAQISSQDRISIVPTWRDGRLVMPPADVLPEGYAASSDVPAAVQKRAWRDIAAAAAAEPKLALVLGAAYGGPWIERHQRDSFWIHMTGGSSQGKTTTLKVAAAIYGAPRLVITPWNGTPLGTTVALGQLGCLTAFKDELGSMTLSVQGLEDLIFKTTEGNRRSTSSRDGRSRRSRPWRGVLISTGNETITGRILNEGVAAARVVEIETPLLSSAAVAERLEHLAMLGAGYPIAQGFTDAADMAHLIDEAQEALSVAQGGVARRLDRHLVTAIAGAAALDALIGTDTIRPAALAAAQAVRTQLHAELTERGMSPMDRLEAALAEELAADPASYPTLGAYRDRLQETKISGFDFREPVPHVMIFPNALKALAARHGIVDIMPAIRQGARDGRIMTQGHRLQRAFRYGEGKTARGYAIVIRDLGESSGNSGNSGNSAGQVPPPAAESLATQWQQDAVTVATGVPEVPPAAPSWSRADSSAPCVDCGNLTTMRDQDGRPQHAYRACQAAPATPPPPAAPARDYDAELTAFGAAVRRRYPQAADVDVQAAYLLWERATRGVRFVGAPAAVGLSWFHRIVAANGSIPELEEPPAMPADISRVMRHMDGVDAAQAPDVGDLIVGLDVNAQYLAAASSVDCGMGALVPINPAAWRQQKAGYVLFDGEAGTWIPVPLARFLDPSGEPVGAYGYARTRRPLAPFAKAARQARAELMARQDGTGAAAYALGALKDVYAAFLGGMLRSERANHSRALRADWADHVAALGTANMHRALGKATPKPFGWRRDTAYFRAPWGADGAALFPRGLVISDQPGKWKDAGRTVIMTPAIHAEVLNGSADRMNRAIIGEVRRGGK